MAARKPAADTAETEATEAPEVDQTPESEEQPNAAIVAPREYAGGPGWDIGQAAPEDAYRALGGEDHATPVGPVVHQHPGGYARLIAAKGGMITEGVKRELEAGDKSAEGEQG
jgi:hypothetical protein